MKKKYVYVLLRVACFAFTAAVNKTTESNYCFEVSAEFESEAGIRNLS